MRSRSPADNLATVARAAGLPGVAGAIEGRARWVNVIMAWPPEPLRGRVYSGRDRDAILEAIGDLPVLVELQRDTRAWHDRLGATVDLRYLLDEWNTPASPSPLVRARALPHEIVQRLSHDWPKGAERDRAWLRAWSREHVEGGVRELRARMRLLDDPALYDPSVPGDRVRVLARSLGEAAVGRILARYHAERATNPRREAPPQEQRAGWRELARIARSNPSPGTEADFARRLPTGVGGLDVRAVGDPADPRWQARVVMAGVECAGPVVRRAWDALPALVSLAREVERLPATTDPGAWLSAVASARRALSPDTRANPERGAPGPGRTSTVARAAGLAELAAWLEAHGPDVGALALGVEEWTATYPTGWRTQVRAATDYTRADEGPVDPRELLPLRARGCKGDGPPPGFERWDGRLAARLAGRWEGTSGGRDPAAWAELVTLERASREPLTVVRARSGAVELVEPDRARAAVEAGAPSVLVRVLYEAGTERWGLIARPGAGSFEPFPAGRRVVVDGRPGSVVGTVYAGGFVPEDAVHARLDDGSDVIAPPRAVELAAEPARREAPRENPGAFGPRLAAAARPDHPELARWLLTAPAPAPVRANPRHVGQVVRVMGRAGELLVRSSDARARLLVRAPGVELTAARPVAGGVEGVYVRTIARPPPARARWRAVAGEPSAWLAAEDAGARGRVVVFASPDARVREALAHAPLRFNRAPAAEAVGEGLYDAEGRRYEVVYQVVEAALDGSTLATSHLPTDMTAWTPGYPREFQTRDLGSLEESAKIRAIARGLEPERLLGRNMDATLGPPVAWEGGDGRLYVLGGNGRALAILVADDERYRAYERAGRAAWSCWPSEPPRAGFRWVLVRVVVGASRSQAAQLAAASQASTAAEEGRLGRALGLVRSLRLDIQRLPAIRWFEPIAASSIGDFARENAAFTEAVLAGLDPAKRANYMNDGDKLAPLVESVMLGFLPAELQRAGLLSDPKLEDALLGALPGIVAVRGAVEAGELYPAFDLLSALPRAVGVFEYLRARRMSFKAFEAELDAEQRTERLGDVERLSDTPDLSLALAAALYNASRRAAPAVVMSGFVREYYAEAIKHNPRQAGLWGAAHPDPAHVLADAVGTFRLPERRSNPARPRPGTTLLFERARFGSASDVRGWVKERGYHAEIPVAWGPWWRLGPERSGREVRIAPGVVAVV